MRFSLRWLLVATTCVAIITAAIATQNELLADLLWVVSMMAMIYAGVVACIARQQRQAMAIGFVLAATMYIVGLYLFPERVSPVRAFSLANYDVQTDGITYVLTSPTRSQFIRGTCRSHNAAGALAVGLIGCLIGSVASRHVVTDTRPNAKSRSAR
jgi:hypothetical protein